MSEILGFILLALGGLVAFIFLRVVFKLILFVAVIIFLPILLIVGLTALFGGKA